MGMSDQVGNELDEFVTNDLRNNLLGLPLDLATINIARARDAGVPSLNNLRKRSTPTPTTASSLRTAAGWTSGCNLKHPQSLVNFVAAYGLHPTVTSATTLVDKRGRRTAARRPADGHRPGPRAGRRPDFITCSGAWTDAPGGRRTGVDDIDLWVGGLAERTNLFGGLLGSTFNYVFEQQMTDLQNGDRFYYLARTTGMNLRVELEGNSFAEMIMRNSTAHSLKADCFGTADCKFEMSHARRDPGRLRRDRGTRHRRPRVGVREHALLSASQTARSSTGRPTPSTRPASTGRASTTA